MHRCEDFRDTWLQAALDPAPASQENHGCPQCAEWETRHAAQVKLLRSLRPLQLPESESLQEPRSTPLAAPLAAPNAEPQVALSAPVESLLAELPGLQAPQELDQRVALEVGQAQALEPSGGPLGCLETHVSPSVLDRLVEEELASPLGHQSARLIGRLQRLKAPADLDQRVAEELTPASSRSRGARSGGWISFLAACLVGWLAVRAFTPEERAPGRRLTIVRANSLAELSPIARSHMEALGAGSSAPLQIPPSAPLPIQTGGQR